MFLSMLVALVNERRVLCPNGRPNRSTEASTIRKDAGLNPICFSHLVINLGMELKMKRYVEVQVWFAAVELVPGLCCLSSCCSRVSVVSKDRFRAFTKFRSQKTCLCLCASSVWYVLGRGVARHVSRHQQV